MRKRTRTAVAALAALAALALAAVATAAYTSSTLSVTYAAATSPASSRRHRSTTTRRPVPRGHPDRDEHHDSRRPGHEGRHGTGAGQRAWAGRVRCCPGRGRRRRAAGAVTPTTQAQCRSRRRRRCSSYWQRGRRSIWRHPPNKRRTDGVRRVARLLPLEPGVSGIAAGDCDVRFVRSSFKPTSRCWSLRPSRSGRVGAFWTPWTRASMR